jgi:hypothetical protein
VSGAQATDRWVQTQDACARSYIPWSGPCDLNRTVEIKAERADWLRAAPLLLTAVRSPKLGRVCATAVLGSPGLARNEEEHSANSLVGLWPRDRDQRGENGGGKAPGGATSVRNRGRGEGVWGALGPGLASAERGEHQGPMRGRCTGLIRSVTARARRTAVAEL